MLVVDWEGVGDMIVDLIGHRFYCYFEKTECQLNSHIHLNIKYIPEAES